jgi:hypothetical protein
MLFLGAGASRAFGLPDLRLLTEQIRAQLPDDPFKEIEQLLVGCNDLNDLVFYSKDELDLEIFLTVLDALVDPETSISDLGPFGIYLCKLFARRELVERIKWSAEQVQEIRAITNEGIDKLLRNPNLQRVKKLYDELFSIGDLNGNIKDSNGGGVHNIFYHVATTNYDLALESYARGNEERYIYLTHRGFKKIDYEEAQCLDLNLLRSGSKDIYYLKLHGSLDWWVRDDQKIVLDGHGKPTYGEQFVNRILIYPVYEKSISEEPFASLYTAFRRILFEEKVIIVIGYSFRDLSINNAFLETLKHDQDSRIIICTRSDAVKGRIKRIFSGYSRRIACIGSHFGEEEFIIDLKARLGNQNEGVEIEEN